jgi:hypothetical protein
MTRAEELELRALVNVAWLHRGTDQMRAHVDAIVDWDERRFLERALARGTDALRLDAWIERAQQVQWWSTTPSGVAQSIR